MKQVNGDPNLGPRFQSQQQSGGLGVGSNYFFDPVATNLKGVEEAAMSEYLTTILRGRMCALASRLDVAKEALEYIANSNDKNPEWARRFAAEKLREIKSAEDSERQQPIPTMRQILKKERYHRCYRCQSQTRFLKADPKNTRMNYYCQRCSQVRG